MRPPYTEVWIAVMLTLLFHSHAYGLELGVNVNERPIDFDVQLMKRANAKWGRAFAPVVSMFDGRVNPALDAGLVRFKQTAESGFHMILSLKHDFTGSRLPPPDSEGEREYFGYVRSLLAELAPYADIIVIGNEPFLETHAADMRYDAGWGGYPINIFYERLTALVYDFLQQDPALSHVPIYIGAFNQLHAPAMRNRADVQRMLRFAEDDPRIAGIDLHPHVADYAQMEQQLEFARQYVTKPVIVTEWSLVWRYKQYNTERLGAHAAGREFASKYGLDPEMRVYEYINRITAAPVPEEQFHEFLMSRHWFDPALISKSYDLFAKYDVAVATYAFITPGTGPANFGPNYDPWILNRMYIPRMAYTVTGEVAANYGFLEEFARLSGSAYAVVHIGDRQVLLTPGQDAYHVELPFGTTSVPEIRITPHTSNSELVYRVEEGEGLLGVVVIEKLEDDGAVRHSARVHVRASSRPAMKVTWGGRLLGGPVNVRSSGEVAIDITTDVPADRLQWTRVELVPVVAGAPRPEAAALVFDGPAPPQGYIENTARHADGAYDVVVTLQAAGGQAVTERFRVVLENWETYVDEFLPPVKSGWFANVSRKQTVAESDGWAYAEDAADGFFGDESRLVATGASPEYLIWEVPGWQEVVVTLYARGEPSRESVRLSASADRVSWILVTHDASWVRTSQAGWTEWRLSGAAPCGLPARYVRVEIEAPEGPASLQLGRIEIRVPKLPKGI